MQAEHIVDLTTDLDTIERTVQYLMERCQEAGFDRDRLHFNFRVGVAEAIANAMMYGNRRDPDKRVRVEVQCEPETVTVRVTDEGHGFDPGALPDPTLPSNRSRPCGRGIFLIRKLMDEVAFNEQGNSISMVLFRDPAARRAEVSS